MRILLWDLELTPLEVYSWSLWPNSIPITMLKDSQHVICYGARWLDEKRVDFKSVYHNDKTEMLEGIWARLDEADAVVSWNGAGFDSKHMRREFLEAGMTPPSPYKEIDLMRVAKSQFKFPSNKLDYVAQDLGVGMKTPHTGFQLWLDCMGTPKFDLANATWDEIVAAREAVKPAQEKAWRLMRKYQLQDVNLLGDLYYKLLPFNTTHPNAALYAGLHEGCSNCGSENVVKRGYFYTGASKFQRYHCKTCGAWPHGSQRLATTNLR